MKKDIFLHINKYERSSMTNDSNTAYTIVIAPTGESLMSIFNAVEDSFEEIYLIIGNKLTTSDNIPKNISTLSQRQAIEKCKTVESSNLNVAFIISPEQYETNLNAGFIFAHERQKYCLSTFPVFLYTKARATLLCPRLKTGTWDTEELHLSTTEFANLAFKCCIENLIYLDEIGIQSLLWRVNLKEVGKRHLVKLAQLEGLLNLDICVNPSHAAKLLEIRDLKVSTFKMAEL